VGWGDKRLPINEEGVKKNCDQGVHNYHGKRLERIRREWGGWEPEKASQGQKCPNIN